MLNLVRATITAISSFVIYIFSLLSSEVGFKEDGAASISTIAP